MGRKKSNWRVWTSELMQEMMEEVDLRPEDFEKGGDLHKFRFQVAHSYGKYRCGDCKSAWTSEWSWIRFDMIRQRVSYTWEQKCTCSESKPCHPIILRPDFEDSFAAVIERFLNDKPKGPKGPRVNKPKHRSELCSKCGYGTGKPCYT